LQWTDPTGNARYSLAKKVQQIDIKTGEIINTFDAICDALEYFNKLGISGHIGCAASGKRKMACGYKWKYVE